MSSIPITTTTRKPLMEIRFKGGLQQAFEVSYIRADNSYKIEKVWENIPDVDLDTPDVELIASEGNWSDED